MFLAATGLLPESSNVNSKYTTNWRQHYLMMGLDNPIHIAFLLIVVLLVFGAKRLPEMGHSLGTGLRGFKEAIGGESTHMPRSATEQAQPVTPMYAPVAQVPDAPVAPATPLESVRDDLSA